MRQRRLTGASALIQSIGIATRGILEWTRTANSGDALVSPGRVGLLKLPRDYNLSPGLEAEATSPIQCAPIGMDLNLGAVREWLETSSLVTVLHLQVSGSHSSHGSDLASGEPQQDGASPSGW